MQITFFILIIGIGHSIEALKCYVCSSDKWDVCARIHMIQKKDLPSEPCLPNFESYFSRIENGTTIHCCLPAQQIESIKEDHYELCKSDKCNGDIYKGQNPLEKIASFAICYRGEPQFEKNTFKLFNDTCFTYMNETEVIKGCKMEYLMENGINDNFFESRPNSKHERFDELCNSPDIKPTKCYACESKSGSDLKCVSDTLTEEMTKECPIAIQPSNCYHFIDVNLDITRRGCMSNLLDDDLLDECKKSGERCKQCQGDLCNSMRKFQTCLTCGTDTTTCNSVLCKDYHDRCYTHLNKFDVRRGCLSTAKDNNAETAIDIVRDCEMDDSFCKLCSGEDSCNQKHLVSEEYCIVCDSDKSVDCILSPKEDMRTKCPLAMKTLGCFIALENKSRFVRGCMSSLGTDRRKACNEENDTCKSCSGDSCNQEMHFYTCHSCDSTKNPKCVAALDNMDSILCLNLKKCYTEIRDGAVKRGCIGDENIPVVEKCSTPICKFCDDKMNCNNEPVHVEKCIKCDSKNDDKDWCHSNSIGFLSEECNLEALQQGCFHHINDDGLMKRGCVNKLENDSELMKECKSNSDKCKICHGDNCNLKKTFPKCLHCNYLDQTQCAIKPSDTNVISRVCASYMDQCFTFIENKNVSRGCLSDFEPEHLKKCLDDKEMCALCDPAKQVNCNHQKFELERCIECNSNTDGKECRNNPEYFGGQICSGFKESRPEGCFLSIVGDHYKRGCISKLSQDEKYNCLSQSNTCKTSFGTNSNRRISFLECYKCESHDEQECSRNSMSNIRTELCKSLDATCTTGIDDHGVTYRRCTRPNDAKYLKYHKVCNKPKCNSEIFPKDRLQCYQCNGDDDCDLMPKEPNPNPDPISTPNPTSTQTSDPNSASTSTLNPNLNGQLTKSLEKLSCTVLSEYDQCYTYMDKAGQMHRGCLTDPIDSRLLCESNDTFCIKCNQSGCNNQPKLRKPSLKCIHCTDNLECAYGQDKTKSKACEKQALFNVKESCYTRSLSNGTVFDRGCTVDLMEKEPTFLCISQNNCFKCDTPDCNIQNIIQRNCQRCSSLIDGDCIYGKGGKDFTVLCDGEPYPYSKSGCYTYIKDHHVERGCVKDLKEKYDECLKETESCVVCYTDNCNIDNHSLGYRMTSTVLLNAFAIFLIFSYF